MIASIALIIFGLTFVAAGIRAAIGPTLADRVAALDVGVVSIMSAVAVDAADTGSTRLVPVLAVRRRGSKPPGQLADGGRAEVLVDACRRPHRVAQRGRLAYGRLESGMAPDEPIDAFRVGTPGPGQRPQVGDRLQPGVGEGFFQAEGLPESRSWNRGTMGESSSSEPSTRSVSDSCWRV